MTVFCGVDLASAADLVSLSAKKGFIKCRLLWSRGKDPSIAPLQLGLHVSQT